MKIYLKVILSIFLVVIIGVGTYLGLITKGFKNWSKFKEVKNNVIDVSNLNKQLQDKEKEKQKAIEDYNKAVDDYNNLLKKYNELKNNGSSTKENNIVNYLGKTFNVTFSNGSECLSFNGGFSFSQITGFESASNVGNNNSAFERLVIADFDTKIGYFSSSPC